MRLHLRCLYSGLALAALCADAAAQQAAEVAPLELPPVATPAAESAPLGLEVQLWWLGFEDRLFDDAGRTTASSQAGRVALDLRRETSWGSGWRTGLSDRFDSVQELQRDNGAPNRERTVNCLREAWVSRSFGEAAAPWYLDAGRINWRMGVASGYNPTDFYKTYALCTVESLDPASQRLDRLGTVMVRGQSAYDGGSWSLAVAPQLSQRDDFDGRSYALALERTNRHASALLKWAPQLSERATLDLEVFQRQGESVQLGLNATWLPGDALVLYAECAGGRRIPLVGPEAAPAPPAWRPRAAIGGTYTVGGGLDLSLELQYAGDALSRSDWDAWRGRTDLPTQIRLGALAADRAAQQEPLVRSGVFVRAAWHEPFGWRGIDVSGFVQGNAYDSSQTGQLTLTWRVDERYAVTAQVGSFRGAANSEFGSNGLKNSASMYISAFF